MHPMRSTQSNTPHWHESPTNEPLLDCLNADKRALNPMLGLKCVGDVIRTARKMAEQLYLNAKWDAEEGIIQEAA